MKLKDAVLNVFAPPLNKLGFELKEDNPKHYCFSNDSTGIDVTITVPPIYPFEVVNEYLSNVEQKQQNNFYIEKNIYVLMEYSARLLEGGYVNLTPHMFESCMGINGGCIFCNSKELGEKSAQAIQETVSVVIPYMERLSKRYVIPDCSRELSEMFSSTMNFHKVQLTVGRSCFRSCLASIQKQTNKSERKHLKRVLQFALAVFPKSATFIDPSKRALDNPAFWQNSKGVEFTAFNDLNICARKSVDGVGKIFSGVTSIHQNLLEHRQMIRYIIIIVNHVDCSVPVGHIGSCYHDHVGQP